MEIIYLPDLLCAWSDIYTGYTERIITITPLQSLSHHDRLFLVAPVSAFLHICATDEAPRVVR
jgi:hypothetical protein